MTFFYIEPIAFGDRRNGYVHAEIILDFRQTAEWQPHANLTLMDTVSLASISRTSAWNSTIFDTHTPNGQFFYQTCMLLPNSRLPVENQ